LPASSPRFRSGLRAYKPCGLTFATPQPPSKGGSPHTKKHTTNTIYILILPYQHQQASMSPILQLVFPRPARTSLRARNFLQNHLHPLPFPLKGEPLRSLWSRSPTQHNPNIYIHYYTSLSMNQYPTKPNTSNYTPKQLIGKRARRKGEDFEHTTRHYLEAQGYTVARWNNQIDLTTSPPTMIQAKHNPFRRGTTGFPDFIAFKPHTTPHITNTLKEPLNPTINKHQYLQLYHIILIECKTNNTLSKTEKLRLNHIQEQLNIPCFISYKIEGDSTPHLRQHTHYTPKVHKYTKHTDFQPQTPTPLKVDPKDS